MGSLKECLQARRREAGGDLPVILFPLHLCLALCQAVPVEHDRRSSMARQAALWPGWDSLIPFGVLLIPQELLWCLSHCGDLWLPEPKLGFLWDTLQCLFSAPSVWLPAKVEWPRGFHGLPSCLAPPMSPEPHQPLQKPSKHLGTSGQSAGRQEALAPTSQPLGMPPASLSFQVQGACECQHGLQLEAPPALGKAERGSQTETWRRARN